MDKYKYQIDGILAEIEKATEKFPHWPNDPLHALAIVGEEFGELQKDVLQMVYEPRKTSVENIHAEATQTAAMLIRFMASLSEYTYKKSEQHKLKRTLEQDLDNTTVYVIKFPSNDADGGTWYARSIGLTSLQGESWLKLKKKIFNRHDNPNLVWVSLMKKFKNNKPDDCESVITYAEYLRIAF